jgi:hypothetical protein
VTNDKLAAPCRSAAHDVRRNSGTAFPNDG